MENKKNNVWLLSVCAFMIGIVIVGIISTNEGKKQKTNVHIHENINGGINCNDCHRGVSWVNMLDKCDDNVVRYVLKSGGIR